MDSVRGSPVGVGEVLGLTVKCDGGASSLPASDTTSPASTAASTSTCPWELRIGTGLPGGNKHGDACICIDNKYVQLRG